MKLNVGTWDRVLRVVLGGLLVVLIATGVINLNSTLGVIAGIAAAIFIITGAVSFCPAYGILGFGTRSKKA